MATAPVNPQGGASPDGGAPSGAPQASQLQTQLAQLAKACEMLAGQNAIVQPELMQMRQLAVQALRKTMMASQPQPSQGQAPEPQQGQQ